MIFDFTENKCILEVLNILSGETSKYTDMFRKTKVSHTTLQRVLRKLNESKFIIKDNRGHQEVDYKITEEGRKLLFLLLKLKRLVNN